MRGHSESRRINGPRQAGTQRDPASLRTCEFAAEVFIEKVVGFGKAEAGFEGGERGRLDAQPSVPPFGQLRELVKEDTANGGMQKWVEKENPTVRYIP
jgi:hypothetical protein